VPLLEQALTLQKKKLKFGHPDTLTSMSNLASAYQESGKLDLAVLLFEETLKLWRNVNLGLDHPEALVCMNNLVKAYQAAEKLDLALPLFEETLKLHEAKFGPEHRYTLYVMGNLGQAYCKAGQREKGITILKEFIAGQRKQSQPNSPVFASMIAMFSLELLNGKQYTMAEEMLRECLTIREKTQPDDWATFNTGSMLGAALMGQKKYADAEPLLLKGYKGMKEREKTIPPAGSARIPEALDRLIELYTATNWPDEAKKWQAERAKYADVAPKAATQK
jgi:eukaryotic-like serine/threonine-protein kinase